MGINELKQIVLNMGSVYKLTDLISDETLDREVDDTLLDISVAIIMTVCRADVPVKDIILDEQIRQVVHRARVEIENQGLDFAQVVAHRPNDMYAGVKCGV